MSAVPVEVSFRVADEADGPRIVGLLRDLVDELGPTEAAPRIKARLVDDIRTALANDQIRIFLAVLDGEVIGLSRADILVSDPIFRLRDDPRCGYVDQMYVHPAYRGRGIGTDLLERCEEWFRDEGLGHAMLHSAPRAVRFYAREGYQPNREMFKRL